MITIFNRVKLLTEQDPEQLASHEAKLKAQKIPYFLKTTCSEGFFARSANLNASKAAGNCLSYNNFSARTYVYYIYVRKKDLSRAKKAISQKTP